MGNSIITKPIQGYEDRYEVDTNGCIWSINYSKNNIRKKHIAVFNGHGYLQVGLSKNGKVKRFMVHRLVAKAFLDNAEERPAVNHKNGNKTDNRLSNLEWVTHRENMQHAREFLGVDNNVVRFGEENSSSKISSVDVIYIRTCGAGVTNKELASRYGLTAKHVASIRRGKFWKHICSLT